MFKEFSWVGSEEDFIDYPSCLEINQLVIGRYGGNSIAGQNKNEDGCLLWSMDNEDWELAIVLDAHHTAESAKLVLSHFQQKKESVKTILSSPTNSLTFRKLEAEVLKVFQDEEFLSSCKNIKGETSCLIVVRKHKFVWWLSIGDCLLFLFHPELAALGQYQLNQRHFYEWVGQVNTFANKVPCYSTGTTELRKGVNHLFLTTDGLIECPNGPFTNPREIVKVFKNKHNKQAIQLLFQIIKENNVMDSTTIISWKVDISEVASLPSI
ncbi:protein phosphatase 2C domain-containing protein [Anaerobacillus sp. CMMVII]|uniref:protein phosphatase 2C domain-containing protein n=1 Tax=Anaerobacillus sp. CMMVII TaxID=2755588 RepID=UPI0021B7380D|nr:protein phosphatase 2C domain-containing protein [Anaerobacillus sp. CMMVII]MCT8137278.1 protein phosphatase 2C domain-containing protein [Anaerobacillus sp. CMMVII]